MDIYIVWEQNTAVKSSFWAIRIFGRVATDLTGFSGQNKDNLDVFVICQSEAGRSRINSSIEDLSGFDINVTHADVSFGW